MGKMEKPVMLNKQAEHITQNLPVYMAADFTVTDGAGLGDPLSDADDLILDDTYSLKPRSRQYSLAVFQDQTMQNAPFIISENSAIGTAGNHIYLDCTITLMGPDGTTFEAVVLVEVETASGEVEQVFMLALAPVHDKTKYHLVGIDRNSAPAKMAQASCVSFSRGTHITMASGKQTPIEELSIGDKVLTRDQGVQTIRWVGQTTMRAVGDFAPVLIKKGTLNNLNDLVVSPNHRLFIYQRVDEIGAGRSEVLVKAKHLLNGSTVTRINGGFVDYFQLLFDDHQIIFAEGIAAESLLLDTRTSAALPAELIRDVYGDAIVDHKDSHDEYELKYNNILTDNMADLLRRASVG